jgi:hypothetical protein
MPLYQKRRYPWPASKISRECMHELHLASQRTGLKITDLIADAVHDAMNEALERSEKSTPIGFATSHQPQQTVA